MTWALAIGGGGALIASIYLAIKVVSMSRDYAERLARVHMSTDREIGVARTEAKQAEAALARAEYDKEQLASVLSASRMSLESARVQLERERRVTADVRGRMAELQRIIDETSTPSSIRDRLRNLLSP